ncbi:MAG TPA: hypothetical protein VMJ49_12140 [Gaiellaceae bacterium]|nr:hypothetical protein [Gaiellaceae bacterium]HTZ06911.1 hypothetical protein [Gaiellaceae bacterium]
MKRKALALAGFATGLLAGTLFYRRSSARRRDRLDVYFADGSMVSFVEGSPEAERLLPLARQALAAARR